MNDHAIYWLKRDFRLEDNPALTAALANHATVTPLYIVEETFLAAPETSAFHVWAVTGAWQDITRHISRAGGATATIRGEVVDTLDRLYERQPFGTLYSHEEIGVDRTYQRDIAVQAWCDERGVTWQQLRQTGVFRRLTDRDQRAKLWKAFTFDRILPVPSPDDLRRLTVPEPWRDLTLPAEACTPESLGHPLTEAQREHVQPVSETAANATLYDFLYERGIAYRGGISSPLSAMIAGSRLSVHLAWGTLTGRRVYQATQARKEELKQSDAPDAGKWRSSLTSFLSRLHWRDHFVQRLETEPQTEFEPLNPAYNELEYDNRPDYLEAWEQGRTGFPMVDACIRCMQVTGFINFRMRAMLTSVGCHTLHLDWRLLDHPMAQMYTDYEPGIHLSQLQMQASVVGINTIRMYSPNKQIRDQDPEAIFIHRWVPELRPYTAKEIIAHKDAPLGDYPAPLVDWWAASRDM